MLVDPLRLRGLTNEEVWSAFLEVAYFASLQPGSGGGLMSSANICKSMWPEVTTRLRKILLDPERFLMVTDAFQRHHPRLVAECDAAKPMLEKQRQGARMSVMTEHLKPLYALSFQDTGAALQATCALQHLDGDGLRLIDHKTIMSWRTKLQRELQQLLSIVVSATPSSAPTVGTRVSAVWSVSGISWQGWVNTLANGTASRAVEAVPAAPSQTVTSPPGPAMKARLKGVAITGLEGCGRKVLVEARVQLGRNGEATIPVSFCHAADRKGYRVCEVGSPDPMPAKPEPQEGSTR